MEREVMNRTESREMEEILKLLELENIHLSDENIRATYVGKFNNFRLLKRKNIEVNIIVMPKNLK